MNPIKFYLSARFAEKDRLLERERELVAHGFESVTRWIHGEPQAMPAIAALDEEDVRRADVVINFTDAPVEFSPFPFAARGGRHFEAGMARGLGKVLIVCGPRENVFHHGADVPVFAEFSEVVEYMLGLRNVLATADAIGLDASEREAIALTYGEREAIALTYGDDVGPLPAEMIDAILAPGDPDDWRSGE